MNFPGGRTTHKAFRIQVKENPRDMKKLESVVPPNSEPAHFILPVNRVVWNQFANNHKMNFLAVDRMLRKVCQQPLLSCGGTSLITCGGFRKILSVIQNGTKEEIVQASIKSSTLWKSFRALELTIFMRQQSDPDYAG